MIEIDLKRLIELQLSPSEYVVLELLYKNDTKALIELVMSGTFDWNNQTTFFGLLEHLEHNKWIKIEFKKSEDVDFDKISLRQKAIDLFDAGDAKFAKLWSMYPIKVSNGRGGSRVLRASGNGEQYKKLYTKWSSIVKKKPLLADTMISSLAKQLVEMRDSLQYMQEFSVWLNRATWERYDGVDEKGKDDNIDSV